MEFCGSTDSLRETRLRSGPTLQTGDRKNSRMLHNYNESLCYWKHVGIQDRRTVKAHKTSHEASCFSLMVQWYIKSLQGCTPGEWEKKRLEGGKKQKNPKNPRLLLSLDARRGKMWSCNTAHAPQRIIIQYRVWNNTTGTDPPDISRPWFKFI